MTNNFKTFKEVAIEQMNDLLNDYQRDVVNYALIDSDKIDKLKEHEARQLAMNFFNKALSDKLAQRNNFYFDKLLKCEIQ